MERMRDLLRHQLARGLRTLTDEDRLAAAWPVACGPSLAAHGEVTHLDPERVLHIRVDGPQWMTQFLDIRSRLAADLARISGVPLHGIHFTEKNAVRPWPRRT